MKERSFRDRDFLSTKEGFFFCVVGPYHPKERVISYLKYLPDSEGKWRKGKERFKRVMPVYNIPSLLETFELLKNAHLQYLFFSSAYNITMTAVPQDCIVKHFEPEKNLANLLKKSHLDSLQKKVVHFVSLLSKLSNVPADNFGVTGSILLDIHNPVFSDMDLTIYGGKNSYKVKKALTEAYLTQGLEVKRFVGKKLRKWCTNKALSHPINFAEAEQVYERKWNMGMFEDTLFSIHPVKLEEELTEKYGDKTYHPVRMVTFQAVVADSEESLFLPAVYRIREVEAEDKIEEANIKEVVSYEGLYDSLAEKGEIIKVRGKLEHVLDNRTARKYDRVVVGSPEGRGREYIKPT